jgi:hypothetical protein
MMMTAVYTEATTYPRSSDNATQINMYLRNYSVLIGDAAELAGEWSTMDEQEQIHHRSLAMQIWGMRVTLGEFYRTGKLNPDQAVRLAALDHQMLDEAANIEIAYGPSIWQLVKNLLDWGTPLSEEQGSVRLPIPVQTLPALVGMFAK